MQAAVVTTARWMTRHCVSGSKDRQGADKLIPAAEQRVSREISDAQRNTPGERILIQLRQSAEVGTMRAAVNRPMDDTMCTDPDTRVGLLTRTDPQYAFKMSMFMCPAIHMSSRS